jgi:hypothetical protein
MNALVKADVLAWARTCMAMYSDVNLTVNMQLYHHMVSQVNSRRAAAMQWPQLRLQFRDYVVACELKDETLTMMGCLEGLEGSAWCTEQ